jgi:prepilin peptidase CpaA
MQLTIAFVVVAVALYFDLKYRRVPNWLVGVGLCSSLLLALVINPSGGLVFGLLGIVVALLIFLPPYLLKYMGAGDAKLFCVIGMCIGPANTIMVALYTSIAGGFIIACVYGLNKASKHFGRSPFESLLVKGNFPYVLAIFTGYLVFLIQ